jgi:vancomycin resistance protein YoaR
LVIFLAIFLVALSTYFLYRRSQFSNRIYPNVYVNGKNFEGFTEQDIQNYYEPINQSLAQKEIVFKYKDNIATFSGQMLNLTYDVATINEQAYSVGRSTHSPSKLVQELRSLFNLGNYSFSYLPTYNSEPIDDFLAEMDEAYSIEPKDALFEVTNNKVSAFKPEEVGKELTIDQAKSDFLTYMSQVSTAPQHYEIVIGENKKLPKITLENVNTFGIVEKIGAGHSNYTGSIPGRVHNVKLATTKFHGVLIPPGEVLSYNKIVGDISQATGFMPAYVIKNGRTVLGDGGGVCQVSTTLFRAALDSGLPILERKAHAYRVHYYENDRKPGFDATVFSPSVDFKFKNDTANYILIQTYINEDTRDVTFDFWGKKDGRVVELSDAQIYGQLPAPEPLYQDDPTLPKGTTKQVDWAAPGAKSMFTYKVTRNGEILEDQTFYSNYRPWQAVYLVGTM